MIHFQSPFVSADDDHLADVVLCLLAASPSGDLLIDSRLGRPNLLLDEKLLVCTVDCLKALRVKFKRLTGCLYSTCREFCQPHQTCKLFQKAKGTLQGDRV